MKNKEMKIIIILSATCRCNKHYAYLGKTIVYIHIKYITLFYGNGTKKYNIYLDKSWHQNEIVTTLKNNLLICDTYEDTIILKNWSNDEEVEHTQLTSVWNILKIWCIPNT